MKHILNNHCMHTLYCTLILPYLNYACEIWGNTFETRLNKVVILQKRAIRLVENVNYRDHTEPIFHKYKCLKFLDIISLKTLLVIYQAEKHILPVNLQKLFMKTRNVHNHNTRSSNRGNFDLKFCRTKIRSMSISIRGVKLWNELNSNYHNIKSLSSFKKTIKKMYINGYNANIQP